MSIARTALLVGALGLCPCALAAPLAITLTRVSWAHASDGAEISAFDPCTQRLFTAGDSGVSVFNLDDDGAISLLRHIDLSRVVDGVLSVSSVAIDPRGRGFGVATVIPADNTRTAGRAVVFNTSTGALLAAFETGFHPDMVCFALSGDAILTADEGESTESSDAPGGLTLIDLSSVSSALDLSAARSMVFDFVRHLDPAVSLAGVRPCPLGSGEITLALEPEYLAPDDGGVWISMQENNALARFDFASMRFTQLRSLGVIEQTIDASDKDGVAAVDDPVHGLLMPDSLASYEVDGRRYIVTVNEGDPRGEEIRFADAVKRGLIDPDYLAALDARYERGAAHQSALGRLQISSVDGDLDGDGDIDRACMYGTRSFSLWDAESGAMLFDSGSDFERITAERDPRMFNAESDPSEFDGRSDNRGPEPEGVLITHIQGRTVLFIGLERTDGVLAYDITDPAHPVFLDWFRSLGQPGAGVAPEGLCVADLGGRRFLIVSSESSRTVEVFRIDAALNPD